MRVEPNQHALLTKAASVLNKDRSSFILDVACKEAENVLLNQRLFYWSEKDFDTFELAISAPVKTNAQLQKLLSEPSPWQK